MSIPKNLSTLKKNFELTYGVGICVLIPCPFPNFLSQPKNLTAFSASSKNFVPTQKPILLNANNHLFVCHKMFVTGTICKKNFDVTQNIWTGTKYFASSKRTRH